MAVKPILFSTEMVRAILDGQKTQTRRVVKPQPPDNLQYPYGFINSSSDKKDVGKFAWTVGEICDGKVHSVMPPYQPGDILWVRESWERFDCSCCDGDYNGKCFNEPDENDGCYVYKASHEITGDARWHPSIHMPRAAARIFLRLTDVRVERLQDISEADAIAEGRTGVPCDHSNGRYACEDCMNSGWIEPPQLEFMELWDDLNAKRGYGWEANPWVFVYTFERVDESEAHT